MRLFNILDTVDFLRVSCSFHHVRCENNFTDPEDFYSTVNNKKINILNKYKWQKK